MKITYQRPATYNPLKLYPPNIDTLALKLVRPSSRVLELGCSTGYLSRILTKQLKCSVIGIELNSQAARQATPFLNKLIVGDIKNPFILKSIKTHGPFDIIYASAVLEHLRSPDQTLRNLVPLLKPHGYFIITLPNIAHWTARLSLLTGNFNYQDSGLFDRTHLHFYTLSTARQLLTNSGLNIIQENYEFFGPKLLTPFFKWFPNFFTYQVVFKATVL